MENKLIIGQILKPKGIKGQIKIRTFTDSPEEILNYKFILVDSTEYQILDAKISSGEVYLFLKGIADRDAAELLRGKNIEILRKDAAPLEDGRYYIVDIIGCEVISDMGEVLGTVTDITNKGGADIYTLNGKKGEILFPLIKNLLVNVDLNLKKITVDAKRFSEVAVYEN